MNLVSAFLAFSSFVPFTYVTLFPMLNPVGAAFIFFALTSSFSPQVRARLARKIAFNTFYLLFIVFWFGGWIMKFFGVSIPIVQVAGGLIVAQIGWSMMNDFIIDQTSNANPVTEEEADKRAFFPLTLPLTAGPGSIAVALTLGDDHPLTWSSFLGNKSGAVVGIFLSAATVYFCYRYADVLIQKVGPTGATVINKLTAFAYLCIGTAIFWRGASQLAVELSKTIAASLHPVSLTS